MGKKISLHLVVEQTGLVLYYMEEGKKSSITLNPSQVMECIYLSKNFFKKFKTRSY